MFFSIETRSKTFLNEKIIHKFEIKQRISLGVPLVFFTKSLRYTFRSKNGNKYRNKWPRL